MRPFSAESPPAVLTVADALALEPVAGWQPDVVSGRENLLRPVRWVHVAEVRDVGAMLSGDELLLTTGVLLKDDEPAQRRYVESVVDADIAGLVLGLGRAFHDVPPALLDAARAVGLPLVVFRRPVPFVQMTEAIQVRLLDARASLALGSEALRDRILPAVLHGTSLQGLTDLIAGTLQCSAIVHGVSGSVLAASGERVADVLRDWTRVGGELETAQGDGLVHHPSGAASANLLSRGRRWGRLVLIGAPGPTHHVDRLVARSVEALNLQYLVAAPDAAWDVEVADAMVGHLIAGSLSPDRLRVLARVSGLPTGDRTLLPLMVGVTGTPTTGDAGARHLRDAGPVIRGSIESARAERHLSGLVGHLRGQRVPVVLSLPSRGDSEHVLSEFAESVCDRLRRESFDVVIAAGPHCRKIEDLTAGFAVAAHVADAFDDDPQGSRIVSHGDIRLRGLVRLLADNDDMHAFVTRQLGPLLGRPELLSVLSAYLATSMNKAATAHLAHLSRPALYRRLEQITTLLGVELDDMEQLSALYVALLAHHA